MKGLSFTPAPPSNEALNFDKNQVNLINLLMKGLSFTPAPPSNEAQLRQEPSEFN